MFCGSNFGDDIFIVSGDFFELERLAEELLDDSIATTNAVGQIGKHGNVGYGGGDLALVGPINFNAKVIVHHEGQPKPGFANANCLSLYVYSVKAVFYDLALQFIIIIAPHQKLRAV